MTCVVQFPSLPISSPARAPLSLFLSFFFPLSLPLCRLRCTDRCTPTYTPTSAIPSPNRSPFSLQPFPTTVHRILRKTLVQSLPTCSSSTTFSFFLPPPLPPILPFPFFFLSFLLHFHPFFPCLLSPLSALLFLRLRIPPSRSRASRKHGQPRIDTEGGNGGEAGGGNSWPSVFHESNVRDAVPATVSIDFDATDRRSVRSITLRLAEANVFVASFHDARSLDAPSRTSTLNSPLSSSTSRSRRHQSRLSDIIIYVSRLASFR